MPSPIPCTPSGDATWTQRTALDGRDYLLTFDWSQREGHWRFTVADQDGVAIRSGLLLVAGLPLLLGTTDTRRPAGDVVCVDTTGASDVDPGFSDLGTRFALVYFTAAELA